MRLPYLIVYQSALHGYTDCPSTVSARELGLRDRKWSLPNLLNRHFIRCVAFLACPWTSCCLFSPCKDYTILQRLSLQLCPASLVELIVHHRCMQFSQMANWAWSLDRPWLFCKSFNLMSQGSNNSIWDIRLNGIIYGQIRMQVVCRCMRKCRLLTVSLQEKQRRLLWWLGQASQFLQVRTLTAANHC